MRHDAFLEQYKILESLLAARFEGKPGKRFHSPVMEYINSSEGKLYSEELNICREIRNLLTHSPDIQGQAVVEPSEEMLQLLHEIVDYIKQPPLALSYATPGDLVSRVHLNDPALRTMRMMQNKGFSHVPVVKNGIFYGVFSNSTLFTYLLNHQTFQMDESTRITQFEQYIPIEAHTTEKFLFLPRETNYFEARAEFERPTKKERRLAAIFITERGQPEEKLLGLITPWDVLDDEEFQRQRNIINRV